MKRKQLRLRSKFALVLGNRRSQAAEMVLPPGESEGGPENRHRGADQWLFVVSGRGRATVNGRRHQIDNTSRQEPLVTVSVYVPPAYTPSGDELPAGRA